MRPSESTAHFSGLVQQVLVLVLKTFGFRFGDRRRIWEDFVVPLQDEVDVALELLIEPLEIGGQATRRGQGRVDEVARRHAV